MALIPWRARELWFDPFEDLERIQSEMDRFFNFSLSRFADRNMGLLGRAWKPEVDIYDSKDAILIKADLPGMNKEDIDVSINGNTLVIRGEKRQDKETKQKDFIRTERYYGSFNRMIRLPYEVETEKIEATYKDGVLEITLPKKEGLKPKDVKINIK